MARKDLLLEDTPERKKRGNRLAALDYYRKHYGRASPISGPRRVEPVAARADRLMNRPLELGGAPTMEQAYRRAGTPTEMLEQYTKPTIAGQELAGQPRRTEEAHRAGVFATKAPGRASLIEAQTGAKRAESDIATAAQQRGFAPAEHEQAMAKDRVELVRSEMADTLGGIDSALEQANAARNTAYQQGDAAMVSFYDKQITDLQNRRMAMTERQMTSPTMPPPSGSPMFQAPPAPIGTRVQALAMGNERAIQEAGIIGAQTGLQGMLDSTDAQGQPVPGALSRIATLGASDEEALLLMQQLYSSLQTALSQASPEAKQYILNSIRNNPGYAEIFKWQDAGSFWTSQEQRWSPFDATFAQGRFNEAGQLAQQIVAMVEGR